MVSDEPILGQGHEVINISVYSNTSQVLKRHYYMNAQGNFDHDIADFILKKGDYTNTYIAIETEGIPDGVTLTLVDENSHQLYSPVDANNNWVTTACSITVGESNIIPLPAQFNNQLSSHVPFSAGTHNWKLIFSGNSNYEAEEIPLEIEIRDFKVWDIITPEIFPNENVKAKIKTYADTYYPNNYFDNNLLTTNATYDASTGIITYPNQDIDLTIGKHMQVINQVSNYFIEYEVKNPIEFYYNGDDTYGSNRDIGYITRATSLVSDRITPITNITINGATIPWNEYGGDTSPRTVYNRYTNKKYFPPGTYHCVVNAPIATNQQQYTCEGNFEVSTDNCSINLSFDYNNDDDILTSTYLYNTSTPIPNAKMGLVNARTDILITTAITDSNGQIQWTVGDGVYKVVAINVDNQRILTSSEIDLTNEYTLVTDILLNENHDALIIQSIPSISLTETTDLVTDVSIDDSGNITVVKETFNPDDNTDNVISNVYIDNNGRIIAETYNIYTDDILLTSSKDIIQKDEKTKLFATVLDKNNKTVLPNQTVNFYNE